MAMLNRVQLDKLELKTETIEVPAWGGSVTIRELTGSERDAYEGSMLVQGGKTRSINYQNARAKLVARCLIDEKGQRLYQDNEINLLGKLPSAGLAYVFDRCRELSGLTEKNVETLMGNLPADQSGGSGLG